MNDRDLLRTTETAAATLTRVAVWLCAPGQADRRTPIQRNRDGYNGHPKAAAYDRDTPSGHPRHDSDGDDGWRRAISDPTGNAAIRPDRAAESRKKVEQSLKSIAHQVKLIELEVAAWGEPRPASDYERKLVEQSNTRPDPGCSSHATAEKWAPIYQGDLCGSCHRWRRDFGTLPPVEYIVALDMGDQTTTRRLRSDALRKLGAA